MKAFYIPATSFPIQNLTRKMLQDYLTGQAVRIISSSGTNSDLLVITGVHVAYTNHCPHKQRFIVRPPQGVINHEYFISFFFNDISLLQQWIILW